VTATAHAGPGGRAPETALAALGVRCTIEARGSLAVVVPATGERALEDASVRRAVLATLRSHGFTHAAVEPGDAPPTATDAPSSE
jgi:hypothetical protein